MFCKNCGQQMVDQAVVCVKCGCAAGAGAVQLTATKITHSIFLYIIMRAHSAY